MTNKVLLNNVDHHDLRYAPRLGAGHGDAVNQMLLLPTEWEEAVIFGNAVDLYNILSPIYAADGSPLSAGTQPGKPVRITGNQFDVVEEKVLALYSQANIDFNIGDKAARLTAGVRYENTKVTSTAIQAIPTAIVWTADNDFTTNTGGAGDEIVAKAEYNNLLPSVDFQLEPMEDVVVRMSYSRTLSRPDYGNLFASTGTGAPGRPTALGGQGTGSRGNPGLRPLLSDNFDVSLEWYYGRSSYVSAGFFAKNVKNFVGSGVVSENLFGLRDPSSGAAGSRSGDARANLAAAGVTTIDDVALFTLTALIDKNNGNVPAAVAELRPNVANGAVNQTYAETILTAYNVTPNAADPLFNFQVTTPINNRSGNIYGFELQAQHFFGDTGFGVSGSYTNVNGDVDVDRGAPIGVDQFALIGLSDTLNVTGIYDKNGLSARVSYNWRDKFLSAVNRGGVNRNPVFNAPFGTLDFNISYDVTENIAVSLEALNLLSETVRTYGRSERQVWFASELKPRYLLGARYRF